MIAMTTTLVTERIVGDCFMNCQLHTIEPKGGGAIELFDDIAVSRLDGNQAAFSTSPLERSSRPLRSRDTAGPDGRSTLPDIVDH